MTMFSEKIHDAQAIIEYTMLQVKKMWDLSPLGLDQALHLVTEAMRHLDQYAVPRPAWEICLDDAGDVVVTYSLGQHTRLQTLKAKERQDLSSPTS